MIYFHISIFALVWVTLLINTAVLAKPFFPSSQEQFKPAVLGDSSNIEDEDAFKLRDRCMGVNETRNFHDREIFDACGDCLGQNNYKQEDLRQDRTINNCDDFDRALFFSAINRGPSIESELEDLGSNDVLTIYMPQEELDHERSSFKKRQPSSHGCSLHGGAGQSINNLGLWVIALFGLILLRMKPLGKS